jgi:hypothetical protein
VNYLLCVEWGVPQFKGGHACDKEKVILGNKKKKFEFTTSINNNGMMMPAGK